MVLPDSAAARHGNGQSQAAHGRDNDALSPPRVDDGLGGRACGASGAGGSGQGPMTQFSGEQGGRARILIGVALAWVGSSGDQRTENHPCVEGLSHVPFAFVLLSVTLWAGATTDYSGPRPAGETLAVWTCGAAGQ